MPRVSLPAAARNVQSIGRTPLVQTYFGCCSNCHRYGFSFLCSFFPFRFFSPPCKLSLPRQAVELGKSVRGSFKMRSTRAKELWSRARMTECLHARSYRTAVVYRGQTRVWGKGERGALADGDKITLLPTHLHPQYTTVPHKRYQLGGWLGASAPPAGFCLVPAEPHDPSFNQPSLTRPNIWASIFVSFFLSSSQTRTHARIHSPPAVPSTRDHQAGLCCIMQC